MIGIGGHIFQIATTRETTIGEIVDMLVTILSDFGHSHVQVRFTDPRLGDVRRNFSDTTKARQVLGWEAEVGVKQGLRQTVEWFLKNLS